VYPISDITTLQLLVSRTTASQPVYRSPWVSPPSLAIDRASSQSGASLHVLGGFFAFLLVRATPRQPLPQRITVPRNAHSLVSFVCEYVNSIVLCMFPFALICMFSLNCVRPHCFPTALQPTPLREAPLTFLSKKDSFQGFDFVSAAPSRTSDSL
jgi:hypothetical protein